MVARQHDGMVVEETVAASAEKTAQTEPHPSSIGEGDEADECDGTRMPPVVMEDAQPANAVLAPDYTAPTPAATHTERALLPNTLRQYLLRPTQCEPPSPNTLFRNLSGTSQRQLQWTILLRQRLPRLAQCEHLLQNTLLQHPP